MDNPEKTDNIGYTKHKTKTNQTNNTTQYVLETTKRKQTQIFLNSGNIDILFSARGGFLEYPSSEV